MQAIARFTAVLLLVLSLGLHWALLQTAAWTGMIVSYSQGGSLRQALVKTLDGRHPCNLCKAIQQGRAEEKQQQQHQVKPGSKPELGLVWQGIEFNFHCGRELMPVADASAPARRYEPPKPRPRPGFLDTLA